MNKMDREVVSHIDAEEFVFTDDEVSLQAFDVANEIMNNVKELPEKHQKVVVNNARRIHNSVGFLLQELDYEKAYWKQ